MPDKIPPVLSLWTAANKAVSSVPEAVVDVSTGTKDRLGRAFAPPWELSRRRTEGRCNEQEFYDAYMNVLRRRYQQRPADFARVVEQQQVVLVAETPSEDGAWDHRHVLVRALGQTAERLGYVADYRGELHPESCLPEHARPMRLFICGGPEERPWLAAYAGSYVRRAAFRGWEILVGDRAEGVDAAVREEALRCGAKVIVAGNKPTRTVPYHVYAVLGQTPDERDRVLADLADVGVFLGVGKTPALAALAAQMDAEGKPVHVIQRSSMRERGVMRA